MEIINFQNKRWIVKHKAPDDGYTPELLEIVKEYRGAKMVLKKDGILIFVDDIPDVHFEEIKG